MSNYESIIVFVYYSSRNVSNVTSSPFTSTSSQVTKRKATSSMQVKKKSKPENTPSVIVEHDMVLPGQPEGPEFCMEGRNDDGDMQGQSEDPEF